VTLTDHLIPMYVRFGYGFGIISIFLGLISFGMNVVTMITVKGFYVPAWLIPIVGVGIVILCICIGYVLEKKNVLSRISTHSSTKINTEFRDMCQDVKEIKQMMKEEHRE